MLPSLSVFEVCVFEGFAAQLSGLLDNRVQAFCRLFGLVSGCSCCLFVRGGSLRLSLRSSLQRVIAFFSFGLRPGVEGQPGLLTLSLLLSVLFVCVFDVFENSAIFR